MRTHFISGFPRALLALSQEKSSGIGIGPKHVIILFEFVSKGILCFLWFSLLYSVIGLLVDLTCIVICSVLFVSVVFLALISRYLFKFAVSFFFRA